MHYDYIWGLRENSYSIVGLNVARCLRAGWIRFLADPGPVLIGMELEQGVLAYYGPTPRAGKVKSEHPFMLDDDTV